MPQPQQYDVMTSVSLLVLVIYVFSAYFYASDVGKNKCLMTYMFESVKFVEIPVKDESGEDYKKYRLYAYSEGKFIERACQAKFTGIPVLFIPGHGGSFKQVRSLASVTTHRTQDLQSVFHFDFFTSDFKGEYSALYGGTLKTQHEFIVYSIYKILSLYSTVKRPRPKSVIIIGHSMGGMVAKSLFLSNNFDPKTVKLIITLATPHKPVLLLDRDLFDFYNVIDEFWSKEKSKPRNRMENVTVISIGGGARDMLVRPGITFDKYADLNVLTNAIPNVLTSTDHLCIVWCNNFVKTLSRALYDAVDFDVRGITLDKNHLRTIFYYHLVHCSNGKYYTPEVHQERLKFSRNNTTWKEIKQEQASLDFPKGLEHETYVMIEKPTDFETINTIFLEAVFIEKRDWIAECNTLYSDKKQIYCEDGINLSQFGTIGFNKTLGRKYFHMNFDSKKMHRTFSHLVVKIPFSRKRNGLNIDMYDTNARTVEINLNFFSLFLPKVILEKTEIHALFYTIKLHGMISMWNVYRLHLKPLTCTKEKHTAFAVFKSPWNHDSSHATVSSYVTEVLKLILLTVPPPGSDEVPSVDLILDRSCQYNVQVESSYRDSMGVIATRYSFALFANVAAILILTLTRQYAIFQRDRLCIPFVTALRDGTGPWFILPIIRLITYSWELVDISNFPFIWDTLILQQEETVDSYIIPVILYLVAFAIVYVSSCILWTLMLIFVWLQSVLIDWTDGMRNPLYWLRIRRFFGKFPLEWFFTLSNTYYMTGGAGVLVLCGLVYFYKICKLYRKSIENNTDRNGEVTQMVKTIEDDLELPRIDCVHFHITLFLLWTLCTITCLPSLIMWYNNRSYDISNDDDSTTTYCVVLAISINFLWYCENCPYVFLPYYRKISYPLFVTGTSLLLICQLHIFRLPGILIPVFVIIAMHQFYGLLMEKRSLADTNDNSTTSEGASFISTSNKRNMKQN